MSEIYNTELFDQIKSKGHKGSHLLHIIANRREDFTPVIAQLNRMVDKLPDQAKADTAFMNKLRSPREDDFSGAFGELVTNYVLNFLGCEVTHQPIINTQTPDFYVKKSNRTFIVEAAIVNQPEEDAHMDKMMGMLHEELTGVDTTVRISIKNAPIPDSNGSLRGIKQEVEKFLTTFDPSNDGNHVVRAESGATIVFTAWDLGMVGNVIGGWGGIRRGDPYANKMAEVLFDKSKKYRLPFVLSMVTDFRARTDLHSLIKSVVGTPTIMIPINRTEEARPSNTYDGFWGINHRYFERNHVIQSILFTRVTWGFDGLLKIWPVQFQNPHFRGGWEDFFPNLPDLTSANGDPTTVKPLEITP